VTPYNVKRGKEDVPTPGPPPPWGMQKVLCKLRWHTSAPAEKIVEVAWRGRVERKWGGEIEESRSVLRWMVCV
jgi:hypothetical protein